MPEYDEILVVDDDPLMSQMLMDILSRNDFRVSSANSGEGALESVASQPPNLILLDITMPGIDGFEVCRRLKAQDDYRKIPIIFLSGTQDWNEKVRGFSLGAVDFVSKPFQRDELLARVRSHLELSRLRARLEAQVEADGTQRKRAEEDLSEMEKIFGLFMEYSPVYVFFKDETGRLIRLSRNYEGMFGKPIEALLGKSTDEIFPPEIAKVKMVDDQRVLREGKTMETEETFNGRIYSTVKFPIHRKNKPALLAGFTMDITERRQYETERMQSLEKLRIALGATVSAMAATLEKKDAYTASHQRRVADLARAIAAEMGLSDDQIDGLRIAGLIHDIGKISIPVEILSKPTKLTDTEFSLIKTHSQSGYDILRNIEFPWPVANTILQHHERMDGSGYPNGLTGDKLLIESRILTVADVVESMASHRPYRPSLGIDAALTEIGRNRGRLYDAEASDACFRLFREKGYRIAE